MGLFDLFKFRYKSKKKSKNNIKMTKSINIDEESHNWLETKRRVWSRDYKHIPWTEFRDKWFVKGSEYEKQIN